MITYDIAYLLTKVLILCETVKSFMKLYLKLLMDASCGSQGIVVVGLCLVLEQFKHFLINFPEVKFQD